MSSIAASSVLISNSNQVMSRRIDLEVIYVCEAIAWPCNPNSFKQHLFQCRLRLPQYLDDLAKSYSKTDPEQPERSRTDWEDWARSDAETDWEETETSKMYNESYQQRRRKAW